jgi:hypothetical protein
MNKITFIDIINYFRNSSEFKIDSIDRCDRSNVDDIEKELTQNPELIDSLKIKAKDRFELLVIGFNTGYAKIIIVAPYSEYAHNVGNRPIQYTTSIDFEKVSTIEEIDEEIRNEFRNAQIRFLEELKFNYKKLTNEINRLKESIGDYENTEWH